MVSEVILAGKMMRLSMITSSSRLNPGLSPSLLPFPCSAASPCYETHVIAVTMCNTSRPAGKPASILDGLDVTTRANKQKVNSTALRMRTDPERLFTCYSHSTIVNPHRHTSSGAIMPILPTQWRRLHPQLRLQKPTRSLSGGQPSSRERHSESFSCIVSRTTTDPTMSDTWI